MLPSLGVREDPKRCRGSSHDLFTLWPDWIRIDESDVKELYE